MVTLVGKRTNEVPIVNDALIVPLARVTLEGTRATDVLLLNKATCAPPAGAGPLSVTVPVEDCAPPTTLCGLNVSDAMVGSGGVTVSDADRVTPAYAPEIVTVVDEDTILVLIANVALLAPAVTVTLAGTRATFVLLLESVTWAPPAGAGPLSVTVPVEDCKPPTTLLGLTVREESVGGAAVTVREADRVTPL